MKVRKILVIFLACVAVLGSSFCASQMKPNMTSREITKLTRNYQNQGYTLETLRKNVDLIKKTLKELESKVFLLESKINRNAGDIQQIKEIKRDLVVLKKLLLEFKRRRLR